MKTTAAISYESLYCALFGLGLSYGITSELESPFSATFWLGDEINRLVNISKKLAHKQGGHNKFLETLILFLDVTAPRYWWQEFDTYRVGTTKQSESTIHSIMTRELRQTDFEGGVPEDFLAQLNALRAAYLKAERDGDAEKKEQYFREMKRSLPEGYLQRRIICTNAKTAQNIYNQRKNHRLPEWRAFFNGLKQSLEQEDNSGLYAYYIFGGGGQC